MSVETVKIRPEIDPAALAKVEGQLTKTFSGQGRALSGLKGSFSGFYREANKANNALAQGRDGSKKTAKALQEAAQATLSMRRQLEGAEGVLGKNHRMVREMRSEYARMALDVERVRRGESARAMLRRAGGAISEGAGAAVRGAGRLAVGAGAAGLALGAGAVAAASKIRAEMDRAAKSANLSVEEFSRLKHAAELSGTSIEIVEKGTAKLAQQLSKGKLDKSFEGGLRALGVEASELQGLSPEAQLTRIADAMAQVDDDAQRTVISSRLFGEEMGAKLVPMLQGGGAALKGMGDEAKALGLVFDKDAAAAAERLGDAQDKLVKLGKGALMETFAAIVPQLASLAESAVEWGKANREAISERVQAAFAKGGELISRIGAALKGVDWAAWGARIEAVVGLMGALAKSINTLLGLLGPTGAAFVLLGVKAGMALGPLGAIAVAAAGIGAAFVSMAMESGGALDNVLEKIRSAKAEAQSAANEAEIAGLREDIDAPMKNLEENKRAAEQYFRAQMTIHDVSDRSKLPAVVRHRGERIERSIRKDEGRAALAEVEGFARQKESKKRAKALATPGTPEKRPEGAAAAQTRQDIEALAARFGEREYQRAIQGGASLEEAQRREVAARDKAKKDLEKRAPELARAGFVGAAGGPSFVGGVGTTAGGAIPVALDLGGRGGPPPVQIVQIMQGASVEIPISAVATAAEVDGAIRSGIDRAIRESVAEALPMVDSGLRR